MTNAPEVRKVMTSPSFKEEISSLSRSFTKISAPLEKLPSLSPSIEPEVTASGAMPNTSGGVSGSILPLVISVRLMTSIGRSNTMRTIIMIMLILSLFLVFSSIPLHIFAFF